MLGRGITIPTLVATIVLGCTPLGCAPTADNGLSPAPDLLLDPARPAIMGASNGLEMRVWVTQDQDDLLAGAIERYEALPTPMPDSVRSAWRASGLRVIAVPTRELTKLREQIRVIGPEQRDWFGQSPDWSEAIRGREVRAGTPIELADGVMKSPAGRLRVLMRCWTAPGEAVTDPAMHLELAVQLERRDAVGSPFSLPAMESELEAGVIFPRLRAMMRVPADIALVIVPMPEHPETADAGVSADDQAEPAPEGPPIPLTPTLGEAMLTSAVAGAIEPVRRRAVIVLLPRLPDRFRLSNAETHALLAPHR